MSAPTSTTVSAPTEQAPGPFTKDGNPDMRFKANQDWSERNSKASSTVVSAPPEMDEKSESPALPGWTPLLLCYDLETTGLRGAQIVQMAALLMRVTPDNKVERVGPMFLSHIMPSKPIDPRASEVHHMRISEDGTKLLGRADEDLHALPVREGLQDFLNYITSYNPSREPYLMFGYNNVRFDDPVLRSEFHRAGMGSVTLQPTGCVGSTDLLIAIKKHAVMKERFQRGNRKLTDIYNVILGKDLQLAHDASGDVEGVIQVMEADAEITQALTETQTREFAFEKPLSDPGEQTMKFGKHKGTTFKDLASKQSGYCQWVLRDANPSTFAELIEYLNSKGISAPRSSVISSAPKATGPAATLEFGKHKGRTYQDVADNELGYCEWVQKQSSSNAKMKAFQSYLSAQAEGGWTARASQDLAGDLAGEMENLNLQ